MPSKGVVVGSVLGDLPVLGNVAATTSLQLKRSDEEYPDGRPKDTSALQSDSATDLSTEQPSELEAYATAVKALEQTKEVIAGRCARLLSLPIEGVLDVANACSVSSRVDFKPAWLMIPLDGVERPTRWGARGNPEGTGSLGWQDGFGFGAFKRTRHVCKALIRCDVELTQPL